MPEEKQKDSTHEDMKKLIEQNIELTKKILKLSKKNHGILRWQHFFGFLRILLIIIPIVLGLIYLPPFLETIVESYQSFLGLNETIEYIKPSNIDLDKITPDFIKDMAK